MGLPEPDPRASEEAEPRARVAAGAKAGPDARVRTLRAYAHALREEEGDLRFADFGAEGVARRRYASPASDGAAPNENAPGASGRGRSRSLEHETGFEPATLTLAT